MPLVILIGGPTASGKSALAIQLAQCWQAPIISADSRQVYRGMDIATAKPTAAEQALVRHELIDIRDPVDGYDAGTFERDALALIAQLGKTHDVILVAGGTGLYLRTLWQGMDVFPAVLPEIRDQIHRLWQNEGLHGLIQQLRNVDPTYLSQVDQQNPQRLIRALEVSLSSGKPYSSFRRGDVVNRPFPLLPLLLDPDRAWLYDRINHRVDRMMAEGLLEEAQSFFPHRDLPALQTVGYQELFAYLAGEYSLGMAVARIKQHTRNYAKRQMTWFRKEPWWIRLNPQDPDQLQTDAMRIIRDQLKS